MILYTSQAVGYKHYNVQCSNASYIHRGILQTNEIYYFQKILKSY